MVIQGPVGVHREIIPFEYSATGTCIACAATRFRESERADLGSIERMSARAAGRTFAIIPRARDCETSLAEGRVVQLSSLSAPPSRLPSRPPHSA
jgi:hypothetical protein